MIPELHGKMVETNTVVFTAADENYFNQYAKHLINSAKRHLNFPIHIHLYNPSEESLKWCEDNNVSVSYEYFDVSSLQPTFDRWVIEQTTEDDIRKKNHMIKDPKDHDRLKNEILKTYYACTRFIRLSQLVKTPTYIIMLDTDSIIRKSFTLPDASVDIHIFEKKHKKHVPYTQHLASTIFYTGTKDSLNLINDHATAILDVYSNDALYWFLDQETLDVVIQKYKKKPLDLTLVDFDMKDASPIWCAKGPRKFKDLYLQEIKKYL